MSFDTLKLGCLFWDTFLGQKSPTAKQSLFIKIYTKISFKQHHSFNFISIFLAKSLSGFNSIDFSKFFIANSI